MQAASAVVEGTAIIAQNAGSLGILLMLILLFFGAVVAGCGWLLYKLSNSHASERAKHVDVLGEVSKSITALDTTLKIGQEREQATIKALADVVASAVQARR